MQGLQGGRAEAAIFNALEVSAGHQLLLQLRHVIAPLRVHLVRVEQEPVPLSAPAGQVFCVFVSWSPGPGESAAE